MKKFFILFALASLFCSVSAQKVNETVVLFGKDQLKGFTINVNNAPTNIVSDALANKFESQYSLKGSNKKGFHVYEGQACSAFGDARYDIYFTTETIGKKKNQYTQVTLVVSNGNMNCITFANDPRTSRNIVMFLENLPNDVEAYKIKLRIEQLKGELTKLKKERETLEKDRVKTNDKIAKANEEAKMTTDQLQKLTADIERMQDEFNKTQDPILQEKIAKAVKDKQTLQKTQSNIQKNLVNLNNDIVKLNQKLETNAKETQARETELKQLQLQQ